MLEEAHAVKYSYRTLVVASETGSFELELLLLSIFPILSISVVCKSPKIVFSKYKKKLSQIHHFNYILHIYQLNPMAR